MDEGGETLKQTIEESPTLPNEHSVHCHDEEIVQAPDESAKTESGEGGGISDTKEIEEPKSDDVEVRVRTKDDEFISDDDGTEDEDDNELSGEVIGGMFTAVRSGDIDLLEDLLDTFQTDINITWYNENMLMAAIRAGREKMAEFLLDNSINQNFEGKLIDLKSDGKIVAEWYTVSCRQMAYDHNMIDIVELIDIINNEHFGYIKPAARTPRFRRRRSPSIHITETNDNNSAFSFPDNDIVDTNIVINDSLPLHINNSEPQDTAMNDTMTKSNNSRRTSKYSFKNDHADIRSGKPSSISSSEYSEGENGTHSKHETRPDEGYDTMSPQTSPTASPLGKAYTEQKNGFVLFCRPTKAFLSRKRETDKSIIGKQPVSVSSKVNAVGSYSWESKVWYDGNIEKLRTRVPKSNPLCSSSGTGCHLMDVRNSKPGMYSNMFHKQTGRRAVKLGKVGGGRGQGHCRECEVLVRTSPPRAKGVVPMLATNHHEVGTNMLRLSNEYPEWNTSMLRVNY
ncbi:hypothetical protein ScPMuIL_007797 [Solemya velum]